MSLCTISDIRSLVQTSLTDAQLQAVIDREEATLIRVCGPHFKAGEAIVEEAEPGLKSLYLKRGVGSIVSIVEDGRALGAGEFRLHKSQGRIERLPAGALWGDEAVVTYIPIDDNQERKTAIIDLVRLAIQRTSMKHETVGNEYAYDAPDWEAERNSILSRLGFVGV